MNKFWTASAWTNFYPLRIFQAASNGRVHYLHFPITLFHRWERPTKWVKKWFWWKRVKSFSGNLSTTSELDGLNRVCFLKSDQLCLVNSLGRQSSWLPKGEWRKNFCPISFDQTKATAWPWHNSGGKTTSDKFHHPVSQCNKCFPIVLPPLKLREEIKRWIF